MTNDFIAPLARSAELAIGKVFGAKQGGFAAVIPCELSGAISLKHGADHVRDGLDRLLRKNLSSSESVATGKVIQRHPLLTFVVAVDGVSIGIAVYRVHFSFRSLRNEPLLYQIFCDSSRRQTGLGSALLRYSIAALESAGYKRIHLLVRDDNPAIHLYLRSGFRTAGRLFRPKHTIHMIRESSR